MSTVEQVLQIALALPAEERLAIAERLWESVPPKQESDDPAVIAEIERRWAEYQAGKCELIDADECFRQVREALASRRQK